MRAALGSSPDSVPRYETLLELGRGGMGQVLLARSMGAEGFERLVALKRMNVDVNASEELVRRFVDEARVAAQVRHANVVAVHHFGRDEQGLYLVLDYVEGVSLQTLIERAVEHGTRPAPEIVLRVIADALAGLHAVHETEDAVGKPLGILHRDVSTHNVLIGKDGVARLSDFGVAKSVLNTQQTAHNRLVGKLLYMPPEYLQREAVDRRLDVYAMGLSMWVALAGVEPWGDLDDTALVGRIIHEPLPPLSSTGAVVAPELEAIVQKACAKDPAQRYETAAAMAAAVNQLSRVTGWMALHDEVASFVQDLCGKDLTRVREQLARASTWPPDQPLPRSSSVPPESFKRWSAAGVQRIRVTGRLDEAAATAETMVDVSIPAVAPQSSGVRAKSVPPAAPDPSAPASTGLRARRERAHAIAAVLLLMVGVIALLAAVIAVFR